MLIQLNRILYLAGFFFFTKVFSVEQTRMKHIKKPVRTHVLRKYIE